MGPAPAAFPRDLARAWVFTAVPSLGGRSCVCVEVVRRRGDPPPWVSLPLGGDYAPWSCASRSRLSSRRCSSPQALCPMVSAGRSSSSGTAAAPSGATTAVRVTLRTRNGRECSEDFPELLGHRRCAPQAAGDPRRRARVPARGRPPGLRAAASPPERPGPDPQPVPASGVRRTAPRWPLHPGAALPGAPGPARGARA